MRIAVDAMGGDLGPLEVVKGVLEAAKQSRTHFLLVGDKSLLSSEVQRAGLTNVEVIPATQVIEMTEQPTVAFKKKQDSSLVVATRLVKQGEASAVISIGNTGAAMAVALLTLGRIKGIDRPAIATILPSNTGLAVMLDSGATVDCDPNNLYEFALMGCVYAEKALGISLPRLGLLSNGEEDSKGNDLVKRTNALFRQAFAGDTNLTFVGNIEGRDIYRGEIDVVVCDGFLGNVVLKTSEGVAEMIQTLLKEEMNRLGFAKAFALPLKPAFRALKKRVDYAERGGAPLLGINGVCIIGHGRSNAYAILNACKVAERAVENRIVETIRERISLSPSPPPLA
ncbi:MAG: phosphate acyltransferase PlsX [Armatimonadetes bacterium]|nr:phosphate acyltransferase PlsX [Armatimonadota bacterium]